MARRVLKAYQLIVDGDMSGDITSSPVYIGYDDNISIQLNFTGTPTGTFSIEGSLDHDEINGNVVNAGNWVALSLSPTPAASGAGDNILLDLNQLSFPYIRIVYTSTSGTGTLQGYIGGKALA